MKNEEWKKKCIFARKVGVEARLVLQRRIKQKIGVPSQKLVPMEWIGVTRMQLGSPSRKCRCHLCTRAVESIELS